MNAINPTTGEIIKSYNEHTSTEVAKKIEAAHQAFLNWKNVSFEERAVYLKKTAETLLKQKQTLDKLMALEMGKPIKQGVAEIEKCAFVCDYYADHAASFLNAEEVNTDATKSYVTF